MKKLLQLSDLSPEHQAQARRQMKNAPQRETLVDALQRAVSRPRGKYGNLKTIVDGITFASKHEEATWRALRGLHGKENVLRQVSLKIDAQRIVVDFMVIKERYPDGTFRVELIDAKGSEETVTKEYIAKANCLKAIYGLVIRLIFKR